LKLLHQVQGRLIFLLEPLEILVALCHRVPSLGTKRSARRTVFQGHDYA
jgi:hypothetical protein